MADKTYKLIKSNGVDGFYFLDYVEKPCKSSWNDYVGKSFTNIANTQAMKFNDPYEEVWNVMEPLLEIREDEITYKSQESEIRRLWIDG